jgi:hypothetical protein
MKHLKIYFPLSLLLILSACASSKNGLNQVKIPFKGNAYESNRRFFRTVASGESINLETARSKALLIANQRIAASVQTEIKNVTENYLNERKDGNQLGDYGERFQQLTREVMSTSINGMRTFDEKIYSMPNKSYQVWVAVEARKKEIYKRMKQTAKERSSLSEKEKAAIAEMIEKAIEETGDLDN